jgi:small-conductance mechanosensitive channel
MWDEITRRVTELLTAQRTVALVRAGVILLLGLLAARFAGRAIAGIVRRGDAGRALLAQRITGYGLLLVACAWALSELGFNLGVLLGAAGVATVAIGFASQTSLSNVISGFFLFSERPFTLGDVIEVDGTLGEVLTIDLISTKLRTFDNTFVRIPNEVLLKSKVVNYTRFPIRRLVLEVPIAYGESVERVRELLFEVADKNAQCLAEPAPLFYVKSFGESILRADFAVWTQGPSFLALRTSLPGEIQRAFEERGLARPYTHQVLHVPERS